MKNMKRIFTLCAALCTMMTCFSQTDTTGTKNNPPAYDTIRIGGIVIVRKAGSKDKEISKDDEYKMRNRRTTKPSNLTTNWWIFDIGFSNYTDNTDYSSTGAQGYAPGSNKSWFALRNGKSRNVNVWFFMQKLNITKHIVNLKYGLGLELNNYFYEEPIRYQKKPLNIPTHPQVYLDGTVGRNYKKDKLAADYLTVPLMLNFNLTPNRHSGFGFSGGISAGYLLNSRNKTITSDEGKEKLKRDFEIRKLKLSYIAELSMGPVRLYGSYAIKSLYERGLDMTPYNFGFRFSNW